MSKHPAGRGTLGPAQPAARELHGDAGPVTLARQTAWAGNRPRRRSRHRWRRLHLRAPTSTMTGMSRGTLLVRWRRLGLMGGPGAGLLIPDPPGGLFEKRRGSGHRCGSTRCADVLRRQMSRSPPQANRNRRALVHDARDIDGAVMQPDQLMHKRKPDARAFSPRGTQRIHGAAADERMRNRRTRTHADPLFAPGGRRAARELPPQAARKGADIRCELAACALISTASSPADLRLGPQRQDFAAQLAQLPFQVRHQSTESVVAVESI